MNDELEDDHSATGCDRRSPGVGMSAGAVWLPDWAGKRSDGDYMEVGAQLSTRDGRRMGNAYVDSLEQHEALGQLALIVTDIGNTSRMTIGELQEVFYPPEYVMRIDEARARRDRRRHTGVQMTRTTPLSVLSQGDVEVLHGEGYLVLGNDEAVCFYVDVAERAYVDASSESDDGCPVVILTREGYENSTWVAFPEFKGWRVHAGGGGKGIAIALTKRE